MADVELRNIVHSYSNDFITIPNLSMQIPDECFVSIVGPSGCGKSTLLRIIAGLENIRSGNVRIGDVDVSYASPKRRNVSMVFQDSALYPHLSVRENLAFGLKRFATSAKSVERQIFEVTKSLQIENLLERKPITLSGGQKQRVALARGVLRHSNVLLLDEPFASLDANLRIQLRNELIDLHQKRKQTTIFVTHDQDEAMTLSDKIAIMRSGEIEQFDTPLEIFYNPKNIFVARFVGAPPMNLVVAKLNGAMLEFGGNSFPLPRNRDLTNLKNKSEVILGFRSTDTEDGRMSTSSNNWRLKVHVNYLENLGHTNRIHFTIDSKSPNPELLNDFTEEISDSLNSKEDRQNRMIVDINPHFFPHVGSEISISINPHLLYFFDANTGELLCPQVNPQEWEKQKSDRSN